MFVIMLLLMIGAFLWVMETEGRPAIEKTERQYIRQTGEATVALLSKYMDKSASLALSMANIAESLPLDEAVFQQTFKHALNEASVKDFVAGGGIWPEPFAFDKRRSRYSFFWGRQADGPLEKFQDYNDPKGMGYHNEEWYVPARYISAGKVYWSRSYVDPYTLEPMLTATAPIYRKGKFFGVSTVDIRLSAFKDLLAQQSKRFHGYGYVLDRSGTFLSFPNDQISKRTVVTENKDKKLQYISIQEAAESTPYLPNVNDVIEAMENMSRSNRGLSERAKILSQSSYQISLDEGFRIASIMANPLAKKTIGNSFIKQINLPNDPIINRPVSIQIFHIPDSYGKLILVVPTDILNEKSESIIQSVLWAFTWAILAGLLFGLVYLEWVLIAPLRKIRDQVMQFDHSHAITGIEVGELADLANQFNNRNQQLLDLNLTLSESVKEAQKATRAKSQFLANMSHEIRTPMNGVLGMLDIVLRTDLEQKQRHFIKVAKSSAENLLVLINDILDFSKIEAGKLDIQFLDFNLKSLLSDIVSTLNHGNNESKVEIILDINELEQSWVKGDPARIRQIFTNLIANALKFTPEGEVLIKVGLKDITERGLILYGIVKDTGIGIDSSQVDTLFESFSQADVSDSRQYGGTGLGLAICKQLCELMDGSISVVSEVGKGSSFEFTVVLEKSEFDHKKQVNLDLEGYNVLIVDDNESNLLVLSELLKIWGVNVTQCSSAHEALGILTSHRDYFDAAILDMQMPKMDGAELGIKIRSQRHFDDMPLIMMSSSGDVEDAGKFSDMGFSAYLIKPVMPEDIQDALAICIENGPCLHQAKPLLTQQHIQSLRADNENESLQLENYKGNILLVEDNEINQEVALTLLDELGLNVTIAANGQEALDKLENTEVDFDLVLMDCQMPVMDGYEATLTIRKQERFKYLPIIAMTANAMTGDKEKCIECGMNDYMSKPIDLIVIKKKLKEWLN
ncbi:response regulator [Bermanella sp. WJH001]|uniref:response regulator n=1 Tax=Bermanella sp. WJH001 TaxID=3048005 RepID=UPI0024BE8B9B|nr:response regulator [Bermanella sp. WJH001]MDJ1537740.1 response regulator [Bermanella sp. WJH001]